MPKPYLGGFKNPRTGTIYHHAFAQTDQIKNEHKLKFHRDTQTHFQTTKSIKMMREFGTQMEREGLYIDTRQDKPMEPQEYFSSELWEERRSDAALFIQRIVRGMLARHRAKALLNQKEEKLREQKAHDQKTRAEEEGN